jgi:hypothetical protein
MARETITKAGAKKPRCSNWPMRISFPLFLANVARWARGEQQQDKLIRPGEPMTIHFPPESRNASVRFPDGQLFKIVADQHQQYVFSHVDHPGVYKIDFENRKATVFYTVNLLDVKESNITVPEAVSMGTHELIAKNAQSFINYEITSLLVMVGMALLFVEWFFYQLDRG